MSSTPIQRVAVWSGALRACHGLLALCVLALLLSSWRLAGGFATPDALWRDVHLTAGYLLGLALAFRIVLLFAGRLPTDRWPDLVPRNRTQWLALRDMLIFYASLGRAPLPAWYGHNPLWGPVYLLLLAVLALGVATGLLLARHDPQMLLVLVATPWWLGWTLPEWHLGLAWMAGGFTALHLLAVILHDTRGTSSELSAMLNGHKIFLMPRTPHDLADRIAAATGRPPKNGPN